MASGLSLRTTQSQRFALALLNRRFQLVMLGWVAALTFFFFFPSPLGFAIDSHIYEAAFADMRAGRNAYLRPDPRATAVSDGREIYFFPPPTAAIVGGPINALPGGEYWWLASNIALLVVGFFILRRLVPPIPELGELLGPRKRLALGLIAFLAWQPIFQQLAYGNQQSLLFLLIALYSYGLLRAQPAVAGLGLAAGVLLKGSPAVLGLPLLLSTRWREIGWTTIFGLLGMLATLLVVGTKPWIDFVQALVVGSELVSGQGYNMAPLPALLPQAPTLVWVVLACLAMPPAGRLPPRQMIVVSLAAYLLLWPVQWLHYATIAPVAFALVLHDRRTWLGLAISYVLFGFAWNLAWLPAAGLLIVAALRPDLLGRVQDSLTAFLRNVAAPSGGGPPAHPVPRASGSLG